MNNFEAIIDDGESRRLDVYTAAAADISRARAAELIEGGFVTVNGTVQAKKYKPKSGDAVRIVLPDAVEYTAQPENIPLDIVYEDSDLLVVNKPKGMVVHPAAGNYSSTLVNAILYHCGPSLSGIGGVMRPGILHRIDKNTSGLLVVAKNDRAHLFLSEQIKEHSFTREYEAVVYGNVKQDSFTVDAPIGRHPVKRKQMAVVSGGKPAVTHFEVCERLDGFTHLRCKLETGRTHQIRVHAAYVGHPLAGDDVYGPRKVIKSLNGQCLHARKLGFIHPNGNYMEFSSPLPDYFTRFLKECMP